MIIAMCCTRNWYIYLVTELYALLKHNDVKKIYLFIEDDEIEYLKDKRIKYINVNKLDEYITKDSPNYNTYYTKMSYIRCYFSKVLEENKILYLDADTLVVDNIEEMWDTELGDNIVAGVHEYGEWNAHLNTYDMDDNYINSGVLLMDLKKLRKENLDDSMIYLLNHTRFAYPDQDVINLVLRNRIYHLDSIYNSAETTKKTEHPKIIHYIRGRKGWIEGSPRSDIWYQYHNEILKGGKMENCKVRAIINFDDYNGKDITDPTNRFEVREAHKSEWWTTAERYEYLKSKNAVELVEVKQVELPEKTSKTKKASKK